MSLSPAEGMELKRSGNLESQIRESQLHLLLKDKAENLLKEDS